jgi:hypothetical protein
MTDPARIRLEGVVLAGDGRVPAPDDQQARTTTLTALSQAAQAMVADRQVCR